MGQFEIFAAQLVVETAIQTALIEAQRLFAEANPGRLPASSAELLEMLPAQKLQSIRSSQSHLEAVCRANEAHEAARRALSDTSLRHLIAVGSPLPTEGGAL
ncbi:hypothetical protein [Variovorax paradoxus]|uniref:hypothetical protein n=1 Tax=Variovorax paradoxus TaxID=34073 RepID=UPI0027D836B2|nr:hypothetical protein [Variovorax paradoxus]